MYIVKCDGQLLYDPRVPGLEIFEAKLAFEDNKKSGFDFTIYPTHPLYNSIKKLKSVIEVYRDGNRLFRGRWVDDERGWHNERKLECDDDLSFLDDSIVRPYDYQGDVKPYLQQLINGHNAQVEEGKRFVLRNVTVTDPNGYITRANINYPNTWSEIEDKLIKILGGHIMLEHVDGVNYLDYLIDSPYKTDQKIELGKNLLDLKETDIAAKVATAVIPLGAKVKDESGNETDQRLTIAEINGGKDYVFSQVAVDAYGWIFKTVSYDDVNEAVNLKRKGEQDLASSIMQSITIELTALDLSHTDKSVDDFKFMSYVEAESDIHGVSGEYLVTKMNLDLLNPTADRLIIGETYQGFTGKQLAQKQKYESESANFAKVEQVKRISNEVSGTVKGLARVEQKIETLIPQPQDKTLGAMGDSITNALTINKPYRMWAAERMHYLNSTNYGISSTRVTKPDANGESMATRWEKLPASLDAVVVMAGVNDYAMNNGVPLGDFDSRDNTTFYGACHQMVKGLSLKFVGKPLLVVPPIMAARQDKPNQYGFLLEDYAQALAEVCKYYSVPTLDLRHTSGVNPNIDQSIVDGWTRGGDGVHPNEQYHELLGKRIGNAMLQLI